MSASKSPSYSADAHQSGDVMVSFFVCDPAYLTFTTALQPGAARRFAAQLIAAADKADEARAAAAGVTEQDGGQSNGLTPAQQVAFQAPQTLQTLHCPACDSTNVLTNWKDDTFTYATGREEVALTVHAPLRHCQQCGTQYFDEVTEALRHDAVCKQLDGVPAQDRGNQHG